MTNHQSLLLCPDLSTSQIIRQDEPLKFYCYAPTKDYKIELWSNLALQKQWTAIPFTQLDQHEANEYQLSLNLADLEIGHYEFTVRFRKVKDDGWNWYGKSGQNGKVRIVPPSRSTKAPNFSATVPQLCLLAKEEHSAAGKVDLWHFKAPLLEDPHASSYFSLGKPDPHSYTAILKKGSCWLTPVAGSTDFDTRKGEKWQVLLYQDVEQSHIHLWMIIGQNMDCWLSPGPSYSINFHYDTSTSYSGSTEDAHLIVCSSLKRSNYAELIKTALEYYENHIKLTKDNVIKSIKNDDMVLQQDSIMLDRLGYCTWNAFGKDVNAAKLDEGLDSLQKEGIPIAYVVLDDGWQTISQDKQQLVCLEASKEKFPGGLQQTISRLKAKYPFLQSIGVWHALWGYWNGIDEHFAKQNGYGDSYQLKDNKNNTIQVLKYPKKFYHGFYQFLKKVGVGFVKVDNQGVFQDLPRNSTAKAEGPVPLMELWDTYRQDMMEKANEFLSGSVIHSMALTPHILFDPILSKQQNRKAIFRNSDDFFPDEKESHSWHIYANAINSLWTRHHSALIGDWDMFQSDHPFAEYHASSRAISGGPIYITDSPHKHSTVLIHKLVAQTRHDGYIILRSAQAPSPTFDTVFGNPMETRSLLCLFNSHCEEVGKLSATSTMADGYSVCGFWNTGFEEKLGIVSSDLFCASSKILNKGSAVAYVVSGPDQGKLALLNPRVDSSTLPSNTYIGSDTMCVRVNGLGCSLVSISPVRSLNSLSVACLGLTDKYNGTRAILKTKLTKYEEGDAYNAIYEAHLTCRSTACGFWIRNTTAATKKQTMAQKLVLDDQVLRPEVDWTMDLIIGLLMVDMMVVPLDRSDSDNFRIKIFFNK